MNIWKGAFAPFTKHHGGDGPDHVELQGNGWSVDDENVLHVTFGMLRYPPDPHKYSVKLQLEDWQVAGLDDEAVKNLIADQLKLKKKERIWLDENAVMPDEDE